MSSELADAFTELLEANDESCGTPQVVFVDGRKIRAIISETTHDEIILAGGYGEAGGFRAEVPASAFSQKPDKGLPISGNGKELDILSVVGRNGVTYEIIAGSLATEEA